VVRAPARGEFLFVSGLTARTATGEIVAVGDLAGQTRQIMDNLKAILEDAGASLDDVVQIRTFTRDITHWAAIQDTCSSYWGDHWPASTAVQIERLYDERQLIEIEAVALVEHR
jgi:2-iminobutanoate/2-iminopropanoate deaminase